MFEGLVDHSGLTSNLAFQKLDSYKGRQEKLSFNDCAGRKNCLYTIIDKATLVGYVLECYECWPHIHVCGSGSGYISWNVIFLVQPQRGLYMTMSVCHSSTRIQYTWKFSPVKDFDNGPYFVLRQNFANLTSLIAHITIPKVANVSIICIGENFHIVKIW